MKKTFVEQTTGNAILLVTVLMLSFLPTPTRASQSDSIIFVQQTSGVNVTLWSIKFTDSLHGWACGDNGTLVRTSDGGQHWQKVTAFTSRSLDAVYFVNPATGWVVTDTGQIYKSIDSGSNWSQQLFITRGYFSDCVFLDAQTGFAAGGYMNGANMYNDGIIYKTTNGGTNWTLSVSYLITISGIGSLTFPDNQHGWATGMDYLLKTTNIGQSWQTPVDFTTVTDALFNSTYGWVNDIYFKDSLNGFGIGRYGHVIRSRDGGLSWITVAKVTPWLEEMHFADSAHGVIVGERGAVLVTGDTGATWRLLYPRQQNTLNSPWWRSVFFANTGNGWICGDSGIIMKGHFYAPSTGIAILISLENSNGLVRVAFSKHASISVTFTIHEAGPVHIDLCDLGGKKIMPLVNGIRNAGTFSESFSMDRNLSSGIYYVSLHGMNQNACVKALIVR